MREPRRATRSSALRRPCGRSFARRSGTPNPTAFPDVRRCPPPTPTATARACCCSTTPRPRRSWPGCGTRPGHTEPDPGRSRRRPVTADGRERLGGVGCGRPGPRRPQLRRVRAGRSRDRRRPLRLHGHGGALRPRRERPRPRLVLAYLGGAGKLRWRRLSAAPSGADVSRRPRRRFPAGHCPATSSRRVTTVPTTTTDPVSRPRPILRPAPPANPGGVMPEAGC